MTTVSIQEAQSQLSELIHGLSGGGEVVIVDNNKPVARLISVEPMSPAKMRQPGTLRGTVIYMAPDFDAPLEDFADYME